MSAYSRNLKGTPGRVAALLLAPPREPSQLLLRGNVENLKGKGKVTASRKRESLAAAGAHLLECLLSNV